MSIWAEQSEVTSAAPNLTLICEYFEIFGQKKRKVAKIDNFFAPQGRTSCLILVKFIGFMRVIGLQKFLIFGAIRLVNDEFILWKPRWVIFSQNFQSPLDPKLLVRLKKWREMQNDADILYHHAKFGGDAPLFFVCLSRSRCWTWIKDWRTRCLVIQIAILSPFIGHFWCGFQHSLEDEMLFQMFEKKFELCRKVAPYLS